MIIEKIQTLSKEQIDFCLTHQKDKKSIFFDMRDYTKLENKHWQDAFSNLDYFKIGSLQQLELYYIYNVLSYSPKGKSKAITSYFKIVDDLIINISEKSIILTNNLFINLDISKLNEYNETLKHQNLELIDNGKNIKYYLSDEEYIKLLRYYCILYYTYMIGYTGMNSGVDRARSFKAGLDHIGQDNYMNKRDIFDKLFDKVIKKIIKL